MSSGALIIAPRTHPVPRQVPALLVSSWVASRVARALADDGVAVTIAPPPAAVRGDWSPPGGSDIRGLAFFGHGSEFYIVGEDGQPLFDIGNCSSLAGGWFYAYACLAGCEFVHHVAPHSLVAAGYTVSLVVDLEPEQWSPSLVDAMVEFLATVPRMLARAVGDDAEIRQQVEKRAERVVALLAEMEDPPSGVEIAVQQLSLRLVISRAFAVEIADGAMAHEE